MESERNWAEEMLRDAKQELDEKVEELANHKALVESFLHEHPELAECLVATAKNPM